MSHSAPAMSGSVDPPSALVDSLGAAAAALGEDGRLRHANALFRARVGIVDGELESVDLSSLVNEHDRDAVTAAMSQSRAGGAPAMVEARLRGADGGLVRLTFIPLLPSHQAATLLVFVTELAGSSVNAHGSAPGANHFDHAFPGPGDSSSLLDAVFNSSPVGLAFLDTEGRYLRINATLAALNGLPVEAHIGKTAAELLPDVWTHQEEQFRHVIETGAPVTDHIVEGVAPADPGVRRWWLSNYSPVAGPDGSVAGVAAAMVEVTEQVRAKGTQQETESRLEALLESIPAMVVVADPQGRAVFTNRAWEDFSGLPADDGPNWARRGYIHPEDLPAAAAAWQKALATGEGYDIDYRVRRHSGEYCWVAFKICPVLDTHGTRIAWCSAAIDIDSRVADRDSLVQSEARLKALIDATPAMVVMTDRAGVTQLVSQQWTSFTGLDAEHTQGWEQLEMIHPDDAAATAEERRVGFATRKGYSVDYRLRGVDGAYRWVNATVRPAMAPDGRTLGWMFVGLDVHDRVLARERLEGLNADLRQLAESIPAIVVTAPDDASIPPFANQRWAEYTGVPLDEATPDMVNRLIHRDDAERVVAHWDKASKTHSAYEIEFRLRRADGAYRWFSWRTQPMQDADGKPFGWIAAALDIDEQVQAREQLELANEHLRLLNEAGNAIADAPDYDSATREAAATIVPSFADWCTVDLREGDTIVRKVAMHSDAIGEQFARILASTPPPMDSPEDPLTNVILSGRPLFVPIVSEDLTVFRRSDEQFEAVRGMMPNSFISVPLRSPGGRTYGALTVARVRGRPNFNEQDFTTLQELGRRFGAVLDRARLFSEVLRVVGHLRLLADAGLALSSSGELEEALEHATALLVPDYADLCTVDVVEADVVKRVRLAHSLRVDGALAELARSRVIRRTDREDSVVRMIHDGEPVLMSSGPEDVSEVSTRSENEREWARRLNSGSTIGVPLRAGERSFGVLGLMRVKGRDAFDDSDLRLATELGRQLGGWIERARLFSELRQALAAKDEFFGFVSHELKTPLTTVAGVADVLSRRYSELDEAERREALSLIHRDSLRLEQIIANMLTLARSERSSGDEPTLVQHIAASTVATHLQRNPGRPVELRAPSGLPPVLAPSGWIDRVLENLISNAEKYSAAGSTIEVEAHADDGHVEVRVLDRGRGISPEQMAEVFEPFFRADPNEPGVPGVGLGLTVCRRLIERLGGEVWLAPREGGGTEAGFRLPVMAVPDD